MGLSSGGGQGLLLVAVCGPHCGGSRCKAQALRRVGCSGSRAPASVGVAARLSCSVACGTFPAQGSSLCPCSGRQVLTHCTTREVQRVTFQLEKPFHILTLADIIFLIIPKSPIFFCLFAHSNSKVIKRRLNGILVTFWACLIQL